MISVLITLASPDGELRQGLEAALRNYLISKSNALSPVPLQKAKCTVDGMSVIRTMQSWCTGGEFCQAFVQACMPDKEFLPLALDIVMDTYGTCRIKEMTQNCRGTTTRNIVVGGAGQAVPKSCNWATFLRDASTKQS